MPQHQDCQEEQDQAGAGRQHQPTARETDNDQVGKPAQAHAVDEAYRFQQQQRAGQGRGGVDGPEIAVGQLQVRPNLTAEQGDEIGLAEGR